MLPKPASVKKRPWGDQETVLRGASPKECVISQLRLKMHASGGEVPKMQICRGANMGPRSREQLARVRLRLRARVRARVG